MINFDCNNKKIKAELKDIIRMYVPFFEGDLNVVLRFFGKNCTVEVDGKIYHYHCGGKAVNNFIKPKTAKCRRRIIKIKPDGFIRFNQKFYIRKLTKRLKKNLYIALRQHFGRELPWGSLTGIRPTKIGYSFLAACGTGKSDSRGMTDRIDKTCGTDKSGSRIDKIAEILQNRYYVSKAKSMLTQQVIQNQQGFISRDENKVNLYVHIPFCPTKCQYCSFVSLPSAKNEELISEYLTLLCTEIKATKDLLIRQNKEILSIYIGGGTPTVLDEKQLEMLLQAIDIGDMYFCKNGKKPNFANNAKTDWNKIEFTLEAGRPDTITSEKLRIMRDNGVNRISINPQTFSEKTLQTIGRNHSVSSVYYAFGLSQAYGFLINMDLIAGLNGETLDDFKHSLDCASRLKPHNITVHTLSVKNGSKAYENGLRHSGCMVTDMLDYTYARLTSDGYLPYYLYRQKNMAENLENVGFCLKNMQSVNNITVMEEATSVWGCGAGAISKTVKYPACGLSTANINANGGSNIIIPRGSMINRHASLRDVKLYIQNFDERLALKLKFLAN